jgi:hypothetical protein
MLVKTKKYSKYLWKSHNLTSLTNQGSYEFPADYRSMVCGGKIEMMFKRIQDRCSIKKGGLFMELGSE